MAIRTAAGDSGRGQLVSLYIFFLTAVAYLIGTLVLYVMLEKRAAEIPGFKPQEEQNSRNTALAIDSSFAVLSTSPRPITPKADTFRYRLFEQCEDDTVEERGRLLPRSHSPPSYSSGIRGEKPPADSDAAAAAVAPDVSTVARRVRKPAFLVFGVFVVCLACFPGLCTNIKPVTWDIGKLSSLHTSRCGDDYRSHERCNALCLHLL